MWLMSEGPRLTHPRRHGQSITVASLFCLLQQVLFFFLTKDYDLKDFLHICFTSKEILKYFISL